MKMMVSAVSTKPRSKMGIARAPIAKDETTMFAESHCPRHIPVSIARRSQNCLIWRSWPFAPSHTMHGSARPRK